MKRFLSLLLVLMLLPVLPAAAEDADDADDLEEVEENVILDDDGNEILVDEETGESFILSDSQREDLIELDESIDESVDPDSLELNPNLPPHIYNILLLGTDGRDPKYATLQESQDAEGKDGSKGIVQRADVWLIVSINTETGEIKMTSLARDTYLLPPGYQKKTKITNMYAYKNRKGNVGANAELCMRTLNHYFDLNIKDYVAINFYGLVAIIDSIGGVDIDLSKAEANAINAYIKKYAARMAKTYDTKGNKNRTRLESRAGVQHLDGVQAVVYARLRHTSTKDTKLSGDFGRNERQRHLMDVLLQTVMKDMSFSKLMSLIESCLPYAVTNMNAETMVDIAFKIIPSLNTMLGSSDPLIQQHQIPMAKTYGYAKLDDGSDVVTISDASIEKNKVALHEFIYGTYIPSSAE